MRVVHNIPAMNSHRNLTQTTGSLNKTLERLSSGLRVNRAADDAGGLAISEKLRAQVGGLEIAVSNAQDGISLIQTAEGALDRTHAILRRIRDLTELAANGDKTDGDREHYQAEVDALITEIDRIALTTEYNTKKLLNGTIGATATEKADTGNISQASKLVVDGIVRSTGEYKLSVYKQAERAKALILGGTAAGPAMDAAGGLYDFMGTVAANAGDYTFKIESEGKIALATVTAESNAGDSMSEAIDKVNEALEDAGIDATASYAINAEAQNNYEGIIIESNKYGSAHEVHVEVSAQPSGSPYDESLRNATQTGTNTFAIYNSDLTDNTGKLLSTTQIGGTTAIGATVAYIDDLGLSDGISTGTFAVTTRDGDRQIVSVSAMLTATSNATIADLLVRINALSDVTASYDQSTGAFTLTDSSTGVGVFKVENGGTTWDFGFADRFGIYQEVYGDTITGTRISKTDDYVVKVTDPDNNEAFLRANQGNRSSSFSATSSFYALKQSGIDPDLAGEETQDAGGIAGISFELEEIQLLGFFDEGGGAAVHDHFSILATAGSLTLQVGPNEGDDHRVLFSVDDMGSEALGMAGGLLDISTQGAAFDVIDAGTIDEAINRVSKQRGRLGAVQNRLEHTIKNLWVTKENLQSSESRIRDADMAKEMMDFTKFQIMLQAGTAMLAQANTIPQAVLQLLG